MKNNKIKKNMEVNLHRLYLKERRKELGWTVLDVGIYTDISKGYYAQIENGFRGKSLSVKLLIQIANALDMELYTAIIGEKQFIEDIENFNRKGKPSG